MADIPHFIQVFNVKIDNAFHVRLVNFYDAAVCNVFA